MNSALRKQCTKFVVCSSFKLVSLTSGLSLSLSPTSALQELVQCKRRHVREQCGEAASIFMRDHLPRITNPVLEQHCSAFTYGPGTCDEALHRRRMIDGQLVQVQPVMFHQQNRDSLLPPHDDSQHDSSPASGLQSTGFITISGLILASLIF